MWEQGCVWGWPWHMLGVCRGLRRWEVDGALGSGARVCGARRVGLCKLEVRGGWDEMDGMDEMLMEAGWI